MERGCLLTTVVTLLVLFPHVIVNGDGSLSEFTSASLPSQDSQTVLDERDELEQLVRVDLVIDDLRDLEMSTAAMKRQISAYGTAALKKSADVVIDGMNMLKDRCTSTFKMFSTQSETALQKLHSALDHLVHDEPEKTSSDIAQITDIIVGLTTSAGELSSQSHTVKQGVMSLLTDVGGTLSAQQQEKERYLQQERQLQGELVELEQKVKNAASAAEKARIEAESAKQEALRQKKKLKKKKKKWGGLVGAAMKVLDDGFNIELHKPYTKRREQAERQQRAFEAQAAKQTEFARQAEAQRADLKVKKDAVDATIAKIVATKDALSKASREITELAVITGDLTTFWKMMDNSCQDIIKSTSVANDVSRAADGVMEMALLQSRPFRTKVVRFHSKWMALKLISSDYLSHFKSPKDEL